MEHGARAMVSQVEEPRSGGGGGVGLSENARQGGGWDGQSNRKSRGRGDCPES